MSGFLVERWFHSNCASKRWYKMSLKKSNDIFYFVIPLELIKSPTHVSLNVEFTLCLYLYKTMSAFLWNALVTQLLLTFSFTFTFTWIFYTYITVIRKTWLKVNYYWFNYNFNNISRINFCQQYTTSWP